MGATDFGHIFEHYDWKLGVRELQQKADSEYGHQQGYSGQINCVDDFSLHHPTRKIKSTKDAWDYADDRIRHMSKREGEVIDLGVVGYSIAKAVVKEYHGQVGIDPRTLKNSKSPAFLFNARGGVEYEGTMAEMKERGKRLALQQKFAHDYYVVSKNSPKIFIITGEGKLVKSTTRKSDSQTLVLPYHKFAVYGLAPS